MTLAAHDFSYISNLVRAQSAIVLEPGKEYLVESRLLPVARSAGEATVAGLVSRLQRRTDPALTHQVVDAMTTNETSWFRDVHPFDALTKKVLPDLLSRRGPAARLSIWSGASSSGQEPYTLAMLLRKHLPGAATASIVATDISDSMLARTAAGRYSQLEINRGLPAPMLVENFDRAGAEWVVKPELRRMVTTRKLNLNEPFPVFGPFDVVFLRNVLIYFDAATKKQVLDKVRRVMRPDGYLFLGSAETTLNLDTTFHRVQFDKASCYRLSP